MGTGVANELAVDLARYQLGWADPDAVVYRPAKGLSEQMVRDMSWMKGEPGWITARRLRALARFEAQPLPAWGPDLTGLDFDDIYYYVKPAETVSQSWDDVPESVKDTYEKLGIPEAERKFLAGVSAQYESEVVYHRNRDELTAQGVLFCDMDTAVRDYPTLVKRYFGKVIPAADNRFAALNTAVWSGGSFIYVPPGVTVDMPLQAYFRINSENMGQFERTLIVADEGSQVHYLEGCSAPSYTTDSLHSAVVEIVVKPGARVTYTTIQNWSDNVYNLVTKRARVETGGHMEWIDGNIGCIAEGMRVTTPSGPKHIEYIVPGEHVLSYDEIEGELCWREVTATRMSGHQPVLPVSIGQRTIWTTANHPFLSFTHDPDRAKKLGRYDVAYVRADELFKAITPCTSLDYGEAHKLKVPSTDVEFVGGNGASRFVTRRDRVARLSDIAETTTDDVMWLFGLYLADGSIDSEAAKGGGLRWAKVQFSVPTTDRAYPQLRKVMNELMPGTDPTVRSDEIVSTWNSVELAEWFTANGFVTGCRAKSVPDWVLSLPESQRLAFVAGFMEGDGCIVPSSWAYSAKSVNEPLLDGISDVLTSLGIHCRKHVEGPTQRGTVVCGNVTNALVSFRVVWSIDERLGPYLSQHWHDRGSDTPERQRRCFRTIGRSNIVLPEAVDIRTCRTGAAKALTRTWDIEVAGTGNFVCEGFVVHNSQLTMKYPACYLVGPGASGQVLSVAYAGAGQRQDTGAKMVHAAPDTTSKIVSKSISADGGRTSYRGLVHIDDNLPGCRSHVECDALILDEHSVSDTYPRMEIGARDAHVGHEATVSKVADEQLFYLQSRGLSREAALGLIVNGFIEPVTRTLPMEYAVEWSRLIELQMEGSVG